ncbi:MAG: M20/M25/M40 family metallo-hydrolase [Mycoplasma sp.]|nr:M20/M25/M40 family metallo-hydrolase [Candidatus Hennigella equi]
MKKTILIHSAIIGGASLTIAVPPIAIAATTLPTNKEVYNDAINQFIEICKIPHCSNEKGHEDSLVGIKNYIISIAKQYLGKDAVHSDKAGNVWADIPASYGLEKNKKIIFQGHMDMVWASAGEATEWDKWTHPVSKPIIEVIDGVETIHSEGWLTNLGLDNGACVALMLSLIMNHKKFRHGSIRCIFTANEENGFPGSDALGEMEDGTKINVINHDEGYDYLVNLDTGPIGDVVFNSGGGYFNTIEGTLPNGKTYSDVDVYTLRIFGCQGGHSGVDIGKGYGNPIGLIFQALKVINSQNDIKIISVEAPGSTNTSIPTEATVKFYAESIQSRELIENLIHTWFDKAKRQKYAHDINLDYEISVEHSEAELPTVDEKLSKIIIDLISSLEFGALERYIEPDEYDAVRVSGNIPTVSIETSLSQQPKFHFLYANRFQETAYFDKHYKQEFDEQFAMFAKQLGIKSTPSEWNSWEGQKEGKMCTIVTDSYKSAKIPTRKMRCHGGLECADFMAYNNQLDVVSTGSTVLMEHNVKEAMPLPSYQQEIDMVLWVIYNMDF